MNGLILFLTYPIRQINRALTHRHKHNIILCIGTHKIHLSRWAFFETQTRVNYFIQNTPIWCATLSFGAYLHCFYRWYSLPTFVVPQLHKNRHYTIVLGVNKKSAITTLDKKRRFNTKWAGTVNFDSDIKRGFFVSLLSDHFGTKNGFRPQNTTILTCIPHVFYPK